MQKKMFLDATKSVFINAATLRSQMTPAEKVLWAYLKLKPIGYKFRRQHAISKYIADFYCHSLKLIIEVDGNIHNVKTVADNDKARQEFLESEGIRFLRFTNAEVLSDFDKVKTKIEQHINQSD
ncbi:MAG TPA: endonuclease domain-containing protein [Flavipsychrobacter sp.]